MSKFIRKLAFAVAVAMLVTTTAGCGQSSTTPAGDNNNTESNDEAVTFPLSNPVTLSVWCPATYTAPLLNQYPDLSELPKYKELQKKTNITVKIISPPVGEENNQFNLVVNSGKLPDIFGGFAVDYYYPGGDNKAYKDGVIMKLNDLQQKYAPDLMKIYNSCPDIDASEKTTDGDYLAVPFIRGQNWLVTFVGPMVRKDWLTKLNLSVPKTISDWHDMLTQFKTKLGASAPLLANWSGGVPDQYLMTAYGINNGYFLEDGKIKFGFADPRYYDFLVEMAKWYKEGLIDPEAATENGQTFDSKACSDKAGAFSAFVGGGMGKYMTAMAQKDPNYQLEGVPFPAKDENSTNRFWPTSSTVTNDFTISSQCSNPEVAMAFLNYGFSEEGYMWANFGIEGESYTWEDGTPTFTDVVKKDPNGLSFQAAALKYSSSITDYATVSDPRVQLQYQSADCQQNAIKTWAEVGDGVKPGDSYFLKGKLTAEETSSITKSETQINTYVHESFLKFLEGQQPLNEDTFDAYLQQLKALGLDDDIKIRQTAEDRFKDANPDYYTMSNFSDVYTEFYKDIKPTA